MHGCLDHLVRAGWALVARQDRAEDPQLFIVLGECLLNIESLKAHLRQWMTSEIAAACSVLGIDEVTLDRAPLSRNWSKEGF
jgi:hypothetical protein